jgi:hypothetical protein
LTDELVEAIDSPIQAIPSIFYSKRTKQDQTIVPATHWTYPNRYAKQI